MVEGSGENEARPKKSRTLDQQLTGQMATAVKEKGENEREFFRICDVYGWWMLKMGNLKHIYCEISKF